MRHIILKSVFLAGVVGLSACQASNSGNQQVALAPSAASANPEAALNGNWKPADEAAKGIYVASFNNGTFVSTSPDTGQAIARGTYKVTSDTTVELDFIGAASQRRTTAKCQRATPTTLYCVPTTGGPFNLERA